MCLCLYLVSVRALVCTSIISLLTLKYHYKHQPQISGIHLALMEILMTYCIFLYILIWDYHHSVYMLSYCHLTNVMSFCGFKCRIYAKVMEFWTYQTIVLLLTFVFAYFVILSSLLIVIYQLSHCVNVLRKYNVISADLS